MKHKTKRWLLNFCGYAFLILGIIGLFTPILQGLLFIFIGLGILSRTSPWAKKQMLKFQQKHPKLAKKANQLINKFMVKSN